MKNIAVIVYPKVTNNSSRILKISSYLIENKIVEEVQIISMLYNKNIDEKVDFGNGIKIIRLKSLFFNLPKNPLGDFLKFYEFLFKTKRLIKSNKPKIVSPHSVSVISIGTWAKKKIGSRIIYDAHELETEKYKLSGIRKQITKHIEKRHINNCDKVVVVSNKIAEWYLKKYKLKKINIVKNIPLNNSKKTDKLDLFRNKFNISKDSIIFIYQGILAEGRGIQTLLDIFSDSKLSKNKVIIFMGFGEMEIKIKKMAELFDNIYFQDPVKPEEIIKYTSSADVGLFYINDENICLSYRYCLPNKFYEYLIAGLFISVNDTLEELSNFVNNDSLGQVVESNYNSIFNFINNSKLSEIKKIKEHNAKFSQNIGWHENLNELNEIFKF